MSSWETLRLNTPLRILGTSRKTMSFYTSKTLRMRFLNRLHRGMTKNSRILIPAILLTLGRYSGKKIGMASQMRLRGSLCSTKRATGSTTELRPSRTSWGTPNWSNRTLRMRATWTRTLRASTLFKRIQLARQTYFLTTQSNGNLTW